MKWKETTTRLDVLKPYGLLNSLPEKIYDDITQLAAVVCCTEISVIKILSDTKLFFKSRYGLANSETPIETSFCRHIISTHLDELIIENVQNDPRFKEHPFVLSEPHISFYAGVALVNSNGLSLGTLSVMDAKPKKLEAHQKKALHTLAKQIVQLFEYRKICKKNKEIEAELKSKDELLNTIVESTKIGVWEWEKRSDRLQLNKQGAAIAGYSPNELKQLKKEQWDKRIHPDDRWVIKDKVDRCHANKNDIYKVSYRILHKNGSITWIHETGKVTSWTSPNQPHTIQGTISDISQKVQKDAELEKVKNNQEALINSTKDLLWSIDTAYNLIIANKPFKQIIRGVLKRELYEGDSVLSLEFPQETIHKWKSYYDRALNGEQFSTKEILYDPSETSKMYGLVSFNPIYDKNEKISGVSCFSKNITSEVHAQEAILSAKEEMDKIMNTSLDIICTVDKDGFFVTINKACSRIWGYTPRELIGKKYIDFVCPQDIDATLLTEKKVANGEKIAYFENRYIHKNSNLIPMLWSANWDESDGIMYCIARDNTEKKLAEQQLAQSERHFKTLVQEGTELIAIFDQEANFTYVSPTSNRTLKMSPDSLVGTNAFDHIHSDDREEVYAQFLETLEKPQVYIRPFRFKNGVGDWTWLETVATNKTDEPSIKGIVVNTRNVTDRILHLKAIKEQNKVLRAISWNQSHVVRAPVARLMGLIHVIKEEGLEREEREKILNFIIDSAEEIDSVIKKNVEQTAKITDIENLK